MPKSVRYLALVGAIALLAFGLFVGKDISDARWLAFLFAAFLCLLIASHIPLAVGMPPFNRGLIRTTLTLGAVFVLLSAQLIRIQVIQQDAIYYRTEADANGEVISNPRLYQQQLTVQRGRILDRSGVVLADTILQDGIYYRQWPVESAYSVTGYYSPNRYGSTGIEATFEEELSGQSGINPIESTIRKLLGRQKSGDDVHLTIDAELQTLAYDRLQGLNGAIVVMDIQTGEILVLVSRPSVNPNSLFVVNDPTIADAYWNLIANDNVNKPFVSRANLGVYTPGSTFKTITAGIAIDKGITSPDSEYEDSGELIIDGRVLPELNRPDESRTVWTVRDAIMWSLNVVMAQVGLQIGPDAFWQYGPRLGFGVQIPFDLPVAKSQLANDKSFLDDKNGLADTGFGQGQIQMSPIHLAMIAAMWANNGAMMKPILVSQVTEPGGGTSYRAKTQVWQQSASPATANAVESMMMDVVQSGSAQHGQAWPYVIGGKTGTAELGNGTTNSLFIGFIGDPEPRYAIAIVLEGNGAELPSAVIMARDILVATIERYGD